jgi:hypothetical protein
MHPSYKEEIKTAPCCGGGGGGGFAAKNLT